MSNDSSIMASAGPPDLDPFTQTFMLSLPDGTQFPVSLADFDDFYLYAVRISINYAAQLGASLLLLITIALLTQADKRHSPIFIINAVSLAVNFIRLVLQCLYFTGPYCQIYAVLSGDFSRITQHDVAMSVADSVLSAILLVLIELSLLLQAQVVCVTLKKLYRHALFLSSMLVAGLAIAFRLGFCVENIRYTLTFTHPTGLEWLDSATNITTTISIWWFCAVFVTKLGFALRQRRKLGLRRFGPMQIIFIMGCQTLLIPSIFAILHYIVEIPSFNSNVLTLVALLLPLSSVWAASSVSGNSEGRQPARRKGGLFGLLSSDRASSLKSPFMHQKHPSVSYTASSSQPSPKGKDFEKDSRHVDLERYGV